MHTERPGSDTIYLLDPSALQRLLNDAQHTLYGLRPGGDLETFADNLAAELGTHQPQMGAPVVRLRVLDWSTAAALSASLDHAMGETIGCLAPQGARRNHNHEHRVRQMMVAGPARTVVAVVPQEALRPEMWPVFAQLRGLISASVHRWLIVAPWGIVSYCQAAGRYSSPLTTVLKIHDVWAFPAALPA